MRIALFLLSLVLVAPSATAGTLVVLGKGDATASLLDEVSGQVLASLKTGQGPHEVAVSADGRRAVITNYGVRGAPGSTLTVIDLAGRRVTGTIELGRHTRPHGIMWLPDGKQVIVTTEGSRSLVAVDVDSRKVTRVMDTGQDISHMVALTPDGARAFVANIGSGTVTALDLASGKKLGDITTGAGAEGVAVTPDGGAVWVTNRAADTLSVVDTRSLDVAHTVASATFPIRIAITPDGRHALVSLAKSNEVAVVDVSTRREVTRVSFVDKSRDTTGRLFGDRFGESAVPVGILIAPHGRRAWVAQTNADVVSEIDTATWKVVRRLRAGLEPDGLGYSALTLPSAK